MRWLATIAVSVLAGCAVRVTAGVAVDTNGGIGPRIGLAGGYGSPRINGNRVRRPTAGVGVTFPGGDELLVDVTAGYERLLLPAHERDPGNPLAVTRGVAHRLAVFAGFLKRTEQDENERDDFLVLGGSVSVTRARASQRPPDPNKPRQWWKFAPTESVNWHQYGLELGVIVGTEPGLDKAFGLAHLSALYEISSWPDRR